MHSRDAISLEDLCPKSRDKHWRKSLHIFTSQTCIYCGNKSESIDHIQPRCLGGLSTTENCVPACLSCNGSKSDTEVFVWYRQQSFYDPRRSMAIKAWKEGDIRLALKLIQWTQPNKRKMHSNMTINPSTDDFLFQVA